MKLKSFVLALTLLLMSAPSFAVVQGMSLMQTTLRHISGSPGYWQHGLHWKCRIENTSILDWLTWDSMSLDCDLWGDLYEQDVLELVQPFTLTTKFLNASLQNIEKEKKYYYCFGDHVFELLTFYHYEGESSSSTWDMDRGPDYVALICYEK